MAIHHASSGEIIDLRPTAALDPAQSVTLMQDAHLKLMRLAIAAGKSLPEHAVEGPILMHCLAGVIEVAAHGARKPMRGGDLMYLAGGVRHALRAIEDCSLLVTIVVLKRPA